jgi:SpoVK/Ycf46/Vps4 family AAA+-type ATPase
MADRILHSPMVARCMAYAHTLHFATEVVMRLTPGVLQHGDASVGQRLTTRVDLHELGAPAELQRGLQSMRKQMALQRRPALQALFVGTIGNGQAIAAASLGKAAGVSVLRIDLSAVVSRYIGQTEKNLDRIFDNARSANAILFFDEADALFGKRTEVNDSHDRYANVEVAYLLQKLEAHAGLAILAVRSRTNIDPAFLRRLRYVLQFHVPLHPPKAPLS